MHLSRIFSKTFSAHSTYSSFKIYRIDGGKYVRRVYFIWRQISCFVELFAI